MLGKVHIFLPVYAHDPIFCLVYRGNPSADSNMSQLVANKLTQSLVLAQYFH